MNTVDPSSLAALAWTHGIDGPYLLTRQALGASGREVGVTGFIPSRFFPRLLDLGVVDGHSDSKVALALTARWDMNSGAGGFIRVQGEVEADLALTCRRCLEPLSLHVQSEIQVGIVQDEDAAQRLPSALEPMLESRLYAARSGRREGQGVRVLDLLEEELLLAMPMAPSHEGDCGGSSGEAIQVGKASTEKDQCAARDPHPFAVLAALNPNKSFRS